MSRPVPETIDSGQSGWDADVDTNFDLVFTDPVPLAEFSNSGSLPTASSNDDCLAITTDTHQLWISDQADWVAPTLVPIIVAVGDEVTAITTGTAKITFRMPFLFKVEGVRASLTTASTSGAVTVDINEGGTTILSTKLTIDQDEKTSTTAATPAVISDDTLADDAEITIDIDGAGTGAVGLKVTLIGRQQA